MKETIPRVCMDDLVTENTSPFHVRRYKAPGCYENIVGKPLTDRRISHYEANGWYSAEMRAARKEIAAKRKMDKIKKAKRSGNFDIADDGRLIYRP